MRAIGYVRVSKADKRKAEDKHSIEAQRAAIGRAVEYNGWTLVRVEEDDGKTGANVRRDGFKAALAAMKVHEADMLVVAKLDRLSRDVVDFGTLLKTADKQGWYVSVLDQKIDTSTASGWLQATMHAVFAEYERRLVSERTRDALAVVKANGVQLGKPSTISDEVRRKVKHLHRQGWSASAIARRLTELGYQTSTGKATWHHSVVVDLLKREGVAS